jgi:hypothetical protein
MTTKLTKEESIEYAQDVLELLEKAEETIALTGNAYLHRLMVKLVNARGTQPEDGIYQIIQTWIEDERGGDNK